MRLFIGTCLSPGNQAFYEDFVGAVVRRHPGVLRAIPRGSAHLTYLFSGDAEDGCLDALTEVVADVATRGGPIGIELSGPQVLVTGMHPRLVYSEVRRGAHDLTRLTTEIRTAVERAGLPLSASASRAPHVTLARFSKRARRSDARAVSATLENARAAGQLRRDHLGFVQVIVSTLTPAGPMYEIRGQCRLGPAG